MTDAILLIDDDENDVFFMSEAFKKAGIKNCIQIVRDGKEALCYLAGTGDYANRTRYPFPGLILLDLKLPFVNGLDVLRYIRQDLRLSTIVIVLSASKEEKDVAAAYRLGANAYLVKPSDTSKLVAIVRSINDFWILQNTGATGDRP